jgi:hypothetical protein
MSPLAREDRVRPVFIVGGSAKSPKGAGRILVLAASEDNAIFNEHVHVDCDDRKVATVSLIEAPPRRYAPLMSPSGMREIEPRGEPFKCVRCKKDFEREDRVFSMHIVLGTGYNPEAGGNVTACSGNYEMTHVDCKDPKLNGSGSILLVS